MLINGLPTEDPRLSVFDDGFLRGDGCFEALRSYDGRPFRLVDHVDRMERSAAMLDLMMPDRQALESWIRQVAKEGGDGIVRVVLTRGGLDSKVAPPRVIVMWEPLPESPGSLRLGPVIAPWHPGGFAWELTGVKWLSYAPNMAASRRARREGFDDALLISREGLVLEGPTYTVAWVVNGVLETPTLELGILASVTRLVVLSDAAAAEIEVREGRFPLDRLADADEVMVLSTVKEVSPVTAVGNHSYEVGPVTGQLAAAFSQSVRHELG